ncbi:putative ribonuclease H-like domain-containing protein [Tanacetum coccineum]
MVPRTVLSRSGPILANTVRPVNIVQPRTSVNNARPMKNVINNAYSNSLVGFYQISIANNSNFTKKVNTVKGTRVNTARTKAVLSAVKGNKGNAVKASACWETDPILQIMKKLMEDLLPLEVIPKEGKLLGKMIVSFTDSECVVLSPNIKLTDESYVLLKVPRKDNMYSVDLKNVVPQGGLTCLFAKAILDESNLWDMRLGHLNFKIMNKMKGKQHRASCKTKTVSSISQPLQMLHMDLFGPTFVKSLMKKMYCLVVTDDFSRCPVTILNTIDHLDKFDGKADEGFFIGYYTNSKAFRVFNSRTRIVEENMHV